MSIANELTGLFNARTAMKTSIANKGVTVPSDTKMEDIAGLISQIEQSETIYNGTKWTRSNVSSSKVGNPVYGLGVWTAGTHYSLDGKSWISCTGTYPENGTILRRYGQESISGGFVGYENDTIYYSADGKNWTSKYTVPSGSSIEKIIYNNSYYVGVSGDGYMFYSADGSSWSGSKQGTYINPDYLQCNNSRFACYIDDRASYSTNGSTWNPIGPARGSGVEHNGMYLAPDDYLYLCYSGESWVNSGSPNYQLGLWISAKVNNSYSITQLYSDSFNDIGYGIGNTFNNYVEIHGSHNPGGAGIYKSGSKVSSWGLTSTETNIQDHIVSDHNDSDYTVITSTAYSSRGEIYLGTYYGSDVCNVTADNSMWIDTEGHYSFNSSEWNTYTTDSGGSITFSHPVIYANGIWVGRKASGGLYYSIAI